MEVFRPQQISFHGKPILSSIISGAVFLLLDLSQLGIVGCVSLPCSVRQRGGLIGQGNGKGYDEHDRH